MKVLIVGSGGREHALAWRISRSPRVSQVVVAPGNAGMEDVAKVVPLDGQVASIVELARRESPDLILIGPEAPLVAGAADLLSKAGYAVFGPNAAAANLEGSKSFAKEFMQRHDVPTAHYRICFDRECAWACLHDFAIPVVVKDSGLAAGKGVTVASSRAKAEEAIDRVFARPDAKVVIEELLEGQEISYIVFTDGTDYLPMPLAQDYKQAQDGDLGPMTGGMGAVAPVSLLDPQARQRVEREIVERTLEGLRRDGLEYRGVLYFGLMLTQQGPKLLEYNARMGDPETQVVMPLLESDPIDILEAVIEGRLARVRPRWSTSASACVVLAAPGYPASYRKAIPLELFEPDEGLLLFHAGTAIEGGRLVSSGGRVLNVVAVASGLDEALGMAYRGVERVGFPGGHYRSDIGKRLRGN